MSENETKQSNESWQFPEIADFNAFKDFSGEIPDFGGEVESVDPGETEPPEVTAAKKEIEQLRQELTLLKNEEEEKAKIFNALVAKLKDSSSYLNEEIIELLVQMIKEIAEKILCKEILLDKDSIVKIIERLKSTIDEKDGPIQIFISEDNYQRLEKSGHELLSICKPDKTLSVGDVIIKSQRHEIRSLMTEAIARLTGTP